MKDRKLQLWVLALCALLLAEILWQRIEIQSLSNRMSAQAQQDTEELDRRVAVLEDELADLKRTAAEQEPLVSSWQMSATGLDTAERTVTLRVEAKLTATDQCAPAYLTARGIRVQMDGQEDGGYTGEITLPVDTQSVDLLISVVDGGEERTQTLRSESSMMGLLPVRLGSFSGDDVYNTDQKGMYFTEWTVSLLDLHGAAATAADGEYRLYRNGNMIFSGPAKQSESYSSYESGLEERCFPCVAGDKIELRFTCTDEYGLTYEFPLNWWTVTEKGAERHWPTSAYPTLIWPE